MLGGNKFKLPLGYRVALPVGEYRTFEGKNLEGTSVYPDVEVLFDAELARSGVDRQLDRAIEIASEL
jgi:carboxyl-terminal processing protease